MARAKADGAERRRRWTEWVSKWHGSGQSQAAFCRAHGLNGNTFNFWKRRVLKQSPGAKRNRRNGRALEAVTRGKAAALRSAAQGDGGEAKFTPVRVVVPQPDSGTQSCAYEVSLRGGRTIRIASNFDAASLCRLLGVLEAQGGARACRCSRARCASSSPPRPPTCAVPSTGSRR